MSTRLIGAFVAAGLAGSLGCARDEPRRALDPPTSTIEGSRPPSARAAFMVQNHEASPRRIRIDLEPGRVLDASLPASDNESGHPSVHRFRYALAAGRYRLTVAVGERTVRRPLLIPARGRRWIVVQNYGGELGLEVTVHRRQPFFG